MTTSLSKQEIQELFAEVQKKGVTYIDVQHEIVDHLASDIESNKSKHPTLDFNQHIKLAFGKFPFDLKKLVRTKEKAMNRYWQRRTWNYIKSYFQLPTIIISILLYLAISIGSIIYGKYVLGTALSIMIVVIAWTIIKTFSSGNYSKETDSKYLVLRMYFGHTVTMTILPSTLLNVLQVFKQEDVSIYNQNWAIFIVSAIVVFTLIWCHACLSAFPKMLEEDIKNKYPYLILAN